MATEVLEFPSIHNAALRDDELPEADEQSDPNEDCNEVPERHLVWHCVLVPPNSLVEHSIETERATADL
jgi:hypothetical protein